MERSLSPFSTGPWTSPRESPFVLEFRGSRDHRPCRPEVVVGSSVRNPLSWDQIPSDYDDQIRGVRRRLGFTQAQFAARVGAARKAVVYQWESRKRCPSLLFWQRIRAIGASGNRP
jgi:DNA-binding XRE family transcriptional regulator